MCLLAVALGAIAAFPTVASAASWSAPIALDTGNSLSAVACPSAGQCTAVDDVGQQVTFNPTAPGSPTPTTVDSGDSGTALTGVACPSASQCTAVDNFGYQVTFNPTAPGSPVRTLVDFGNVLAAVACPSTSQCTAVDQHGQEVTFNPTVGGVYSRITLPGAYSNLLYGVACPSTSQCTAVGGGAVSGGGGGGQEWTFDPTAPGSPTPSTVDPGFSYWLTGVACASTTQCAAVDDFGGQVTFNPTAPGTPTRTLIDPGNYQISGVLTGVACPSTTQCAAVDRFGRVVEGDPTTPASWTVQTIGPNGLSAVACSSVAQCVTVDAAGNAFTATGNKTAPLVTGFKFTHTRFTIGRRPTAIHARSSATVKIRRGSAFRYTLSAASTATIVIKRKSTGRLIGTKCVTRTKANAHKRHCTIYTRRGTLTRRSKAGANTVAFSGRIGRKALRPASYRATITARTGNGPTSKPHSATFTIIRG